jgi:hypothetical protein
MVLDVTVIDPPAIPAAELSDIVLDVTVTIANSPPIPLPELLDIVLDVTVIVVGDIDEKLP